MMFKKPTKLIVCLFYICFVILPLLNFFSRINIGLFNKIVYSSRFIKILGNSLFVSIISTIIVLVLSYLAAFMIERTNIRGKQIFRLFFIITMLIPSLSCGTGLIILFGNNGIFTKLFNINVGIYGIKGIILGEVFYAFPIAFLMFDDIMKYESYALYEEAIVLGIDKLNIFKSIVIPFMRKPAFSILFCIFTLIITDYGIPLIVGGKFVTLPLLIYQEVVGRLDFDSGVCYSIILLIIVLISFVFDISNRENKKNIKKREFVLKNDNKILYYSYCITISICIIILVLSFVLVLDTHSFSKILKDNFCKYLFNSIITAFISSLVGTFIAFLTAYITIFKDGILNRLIHIFSIFSLAIPGLVLGISYILFFKSTYIYGTLIIIIIANIVHFISSPYLIAYNSLSKININMSFSSKVLGITEFDFIKDIIVPLKKNTIIEMFTFYFVNCMMTISAVSFLSNFNTRPISLLINKYQEQMQIGASSFVAIVIFIINLLIVLFLKKHSA